MTHNNPGARMSQMFGIADARRLLQRAPKSGNLGGNTSIGERDDGAIAVRLYATDIITFYPDGSLTLNSGGHHTSTTKNRINEILSPFVHIHQEQYSWYITTRMHKDVGFFDGIRIFSDGSVSDEQQHRTVDRQGVPIRHNPRARTIGKRIGQLVREGVSDGHGQAGAIAYRESRQHNPKGDHLVGYLDNIRSYKTELMDFKGNGLGWRYEQTIANWRTAEGDRVYAVELSKGAGRRKQYAGGLYLGDAGSLFRGEVFGIINTMDASNETLAEAEYWLRIDAEGHDSEEEPEEEE